jgi:hypothetical protein
MRTPLLLMILACLTGCTVAPPPPTPTPSAMVPAEQPAPPATPVQVVTLPPGPLLPARGKTLLMHYMPWYETPATRGRWGTHWKGHGAEHQPDQLDTNGRPDIWSHYHPLIGLYDSTDPDVLECHLLQMRLAGINGVIVDWYGTYDYGDFRSIHDATRAMFEAARRFGLTFAVCYEDRTVDLLVNHWRKFPAEEAAGHLANTFAWMQENWFQAPHYHRHQGRPLVLNFGPIYTPFQSPAVWEAAVAPLPVRPLRFSLHHLWRQAGADGGFSWIHHEPWEGDHPPRQQVYNRIGEIFTYFTTNAEEAIVSAFPGYNDVYVQSHRELGHRHGDTLRETLQVAMAGPWPMIQLVTWNDYGEGTMIEPTHEFGYRFLEIVQEERRREWGVTLTATAEDLRLPAQLLALRKSRQVATGELDDISSLLTLGRYAEARTRLSALAAP